MPRNEPHKITIEFEDGSSVESAFSTLPVPLQVEILRQPFAAQASPEPEKEKFLLLEWEDGWKEVIRVDSTCSEINRYYVISRSEDIGRLSLHRNDGYPELVEVIRNPLKLNRIHFQDTFQPAVERSDREGGKTDTFFNITKEKNVLSEYMASLKKALEKEDIDVTVLQSQKPGRAQALYEKIRRRMGINAGHRQQDAYDFIASLVKLIE
jgi:hypothetical protein